MYVASMTVPEWMLLANPIAPGQPRATPRTRPVRPRKHLASIIRTPRRQKRTGNIGSIRRT